jgi:hypothetical protein
MKFICDIEHSKCTGVYKIQCIENGTYYIGGAYSNHGFSSRFSSHNYLLRHNKHYNKQLQNIYNRYGTDSLIFTILTTSKDAETTSISEKNYILRNIKDPKCINLFHGSIGGNWTKGKSLQQINEVYNKRTERLTAEFWALRNYAHTTTLSNIPASIKKKRINRHVRSYKQNRCNHINYKPIKLKIVDPDNTSYLITCDTEKDFFKKTKLESTTLSKLKQNKTHTIKKIVPLTKHKYKKGTKLFIIED